MAGLYEVALALVPGVGGATTRTLVAHCGSAEKVFKEKKGKLLNIPGIGPSTVDALQDPLILKKAEQEISLCEKYKVELLFFTEEKFPYRLKQIHDVPALLYYRGNANLNAGKTIGIVGTRDATDYGKEITERIVRALNIPDLVIISGLAYGIDVAAHRASLQNNIPTIGVMASGIDIIYPNVHKNIAREMTECGGILTEYPFGSKPDPAKFPARNRIVAGLCDAVIVVEAAESGGALITAEMANGYDREVFAVPGNLGQKYSEGCNKIISEHKAHIFTSVQQLLFTIGWDDNHPAKFSKIKKQPFIIPDNLELEERKIVEQLVETEGLLIDELSWKTQIPVNRMASLLLNLEFQGLVKALPGKKFKLNMN